MRRLPTTVVLGGWIGFLTVSALVGSSAILWMADADFSAGPWLTGEAQRHAALFAAEGEAGLVSAAMAALLSLMTAGFLALALVLVHRPAETERRVGERIAFAGFGVIAALAAASLALGVTTFANVSSQVPLWIVLALSFVSLVFDRLVEVPDEDPAEEEDFRAAIALIATAMARDPQGNPPKADRFGKPRP